MSSLYNVSLGIVSAAHLLFGLGNLFKVPPYDPASFMVAGKPGTGDTPMEKLLEAVFGGWYTSSIIGVLLAYFSGSSSTLRSTLVCPLIYHIMSSCVAVLFLEKWNVCNKAKTSAAMIGGFHSLMSLLFGYLYCMTS